MRAAKPRGQPKRSKLDAHRKGILGWIDEQDDITIAELWHVIGRLVDLVTPHKAANFFAAAGYEPN